MKTIATAAIILFAALTCASAISRYDTNRLSCARVQANLKAQGIALLRYPSPRNRSIIDYDYYVPDGRRCKTGGTGRRASVPTADTRSCRVHRCVKQVTGHGGR